MARGNSNAYAAARNNERAEQLRAMVADGLQTMSDSVRQQDNAIRDVHRASMTQMGAVKELALKATATADEALMAAENAKAQVRFHDNDLADIRERLSRIEHATFWQRLQWMFRGQVV